jgi:hypothetical protein
VIGEIFVGAPSIVCASATLKKLHAFTWLSLAPEAGTELLALLGARVTPPLEGAGCGLLLQPALTSISNNPASTAARFHGKFIYASPEKDLGMNLRTLNQGGKAVPPLWGSHLYFAFPSAPALG